MSLNNHPHGTLSVDTQVNPKDQGPKQLMAVNLRNGRDLDLEQERARESRQAETLEEANTQIKAEKEAEIAQESVVEVVSGKEKTQITGKKRPSAPFPQRLAKYQKDKQYKKFLEILKQIQVNIPLIDALKEMHGYEKMMKDLMFGKFDFQDLATVTLTQICSAVVTRPVAENFSNIGSFTIPCTIGNFAFAKVLCNLGASINLMPRAIYKRLGIGRTRPMSMLLQLADRTMKRPSDVIVEEDDETLTIEDPLATCLMNLDEAQQLLQVADHLSRLKGAENSIEAEDILETFPDEQLLATSLEEVPWYADIANYLASAVALPTNDARVVVGVLKKNIFTHFRIPRAIISHGGTHLYNRAFEKLLTKYDVRHKVATPYPPQTSGQVEVSNREIKSVMTKTANATRTDWEKKLDDALWAYKTAFKTPIDIEVAGTKRVRELHELDEFQFIAFESTRLYKEIMKRLHDKNIIERNFNPGDMVLLYYSRLRLFPGKLKSRWSGPFGVVEVLPSVP
uniref:Integrase catalytic domain-containing protein n=1 Tax=Nicotiana tabacum TaxID=4097 RepID=A0A1S4BMZ3_TOBAC|nr:PREDICTED: uncharacterized protein LOC107810027 [Nicotiana tabacum]